MKGGRLGKYEFAPTKRSIKLVNILSIKKNGHKCMLSVYQSELQNYTKERLKFKRYIFINIYFILNLSIKHQITNTLSIPKTFFLDNKIF